MRLNYYSVKSVKLHLAKMCIHERLLILMRSDTYSSRIWGGEEPKKILGEVDYVNMHIVKRWLLK